ncbi:MAG: 50S ribosomal protein L22 [Patescibacteria group bacterium]
MEKDIKKSEAKAEVAKVDSKKEKPAKSKKKEVTEVKASARYLHMSAKKVRLVINQLRGFEVLKALDSLRFVNKAASKPVIKLLNSAIANAENNFQLDKQDLYIKTITANAGPVLKRFMPRAHGRSAPIHKRTCHLDLILGVRVGAKKKAVVKKDNKSEDIKVVNPDEIKKDINKNSSKGPKAGSGKESKGFLKGVFQRKTG